MDGFLWNVNSGDVGKVSILVPVIEAITDQKVLIDTKTNIVHGNVGEPQGGTIEQAARSIEHLRPLVEG